MTTAPARGSGLRRVAPHSVVLLGLALRLYGLTAQGFWRDEVDAVRFATGGAVTSLRQAGWNGPLYTLLLGRWVAATGTTEFGLRLSSVIAGTALLALTVVLGRRLLGERAGVVAALLTATSPYLVWYAQELKMYSLLAMLGVASYAALVAALVRGRWWRWGLYAVVTSVLPYVHILGVLLLPAQGLALLLTWPRQRRRRAWLATMAAMCLPYLPLAIWQAPYLTSGVETGHPYYPLPQMLRILARAWTLGIVGVPGWLPLVPFALALLAALVAGCLGPAGAPRASHAGGDGLAARARPAVVSGANVLLWTWFLVPILLDWLISTRSPVFTDRYLIASLPAAFMLVATGTGTTARAWRPAGALLLALLLAVSLWGICQQWRYPAKADTRGAAAIVAEGWQQGDVLLLQIPYMRHSMDYYLGSSYPMVDGPFTNYGMTEEGFTAEIGPQTAGHDRVWLLMSESGMWDSRGLTLPWCHAHGQLIGEWHLQRVDLYLFEWRLE